MWRYQSLLQKTRFRTTWSMAFQHQRNQSSLQRYFDQPKKRRDLKFNGGTQCKAGSHKRSPYSDSPASVEIRSQGQYSWTCLRSRQWITKRLRFEYFRGIRATRIIQDRWVIDFLTHLQYSDIKNHKDAYFVYF